MNEPESDCRLASCSTDLQQLLTEARNGSLESQGRLLDAFRYDLIAIAGAKLDSDIRAKVAASDIVQDSLLEAHRDFAAFHGETQHEVRTWLKSILLHNLVNQARYWRAQRRQVRRETALDANGPSAMQLLADSGLTASGVAIEREQQEQLDRALLNLKEDYRRVLELRHRDGLTFEEIGRQMHRTADAARMLWYRAFDQLSRLL